MTDYIINKSECEKAIRVAIIAGLMLGFVIGLAAGYAIGYNMNTVEQIDKYKELSDRYDVGMNLYKECTNDRAILRGRRIVR